MPLIPVKVPLERVEYLPGMGQIVGGVRIVEENVSQPGAENDTDLHIDEKAFKRLLRYRVAVVPDIPFGGIERRHQRQHVHDTVPVDFERSDRQRDRIEMFVDMLPELHGHSDFTKIRRCSSSKI
jgi:hypothetical protein